eukprot:g31879.t1
MAATPWWELEPEQVCRKLESDLKNGLSEAEVKARQAQYGLNEIPPPPPTSLIKLILEQFQDKLVLILLAAAVVSFFLALFEEGEDRLTAFVEPAVILIILAANATVGVIQESSAEAAIEALKESEASHAHVKRNGMSRNIRANELVPGDVITVDVGDKVPADARLVSLTSAALTVDESMLTGESEPPSKRVESIQKEDPVNQDKRNILFSGTLVVRGKATAIVVNTGSKTEMGAIAKDLSETEDERTPLQAKLDHFGDQLSKVIAVICLTVWLINIGHFTDPDHGGVLKGAVYYFKIAVALAVAAIPEGLPAVVTTCLALGTREMAKKNAIVRTLPSVETLGCTTVICSDKTGTLTTNKMSVQKVMSVHAVTSHTATFKKYDVSGDSFDVNGSISLEGSDKPVDYPAQDAGLAQIGLISAVCNEATLIYDRKSGQYTKTGAPTEAAMLVLAEKICVTNPDEFKQRNNMEDGDEKAQFAYRFWNRKVGEKSHTLEFHRARKSMSVVAGDMLYCKGAPEEVLTRCDFIRAANNTSYKLNDQIREQIAEALQEYASQGLRCLALAQLEKPNPGNKLNYTDLDDYAKIESKMTFVGLACMLDPPRSVVSQSIAKCKTAGIRVIVITGDNKVTAESICRRIGVFGPDENLAGKSFTGSEFEGMDQNSKNDAVKNASLFSRVEPKHKLALVTLLKDQGEVVAMTGDGVNDSTALKKADIGVAMGSGTDVAKEASDMVLQDDNFATIVMAVEEGRAIYANTKQFIRYLISSNIGEVACIFITAAIGMPEALIPVQLLWVNLVTDGLPATALGFNPPDADVMERAPRGQDEEIINGWMFFRYMAIGMYVGVGTCGGFIWWYLYSQSGPRISYYQLTHFHECFKVGAQAYGMPDGVSCEIFHDPRPSTISLSVLVTIEMFNALNALSENQSLLVVTPASNPYVVYACILSFALHFMIVYVPFFANIFHVSPLNQEEWIAVMKASIPVFFLDEILKSVSRAFSGKAASGRLKKIKPVNLFKSTVRFQTV